MRPRRPQIDAALYVTALPVYARNLAVLLPPLCAAAIGLGLDYLGGWLFAPIGGVLTFVFTIVTQIVFGYAFALSLVFADDAWRHGRANLRGAWDVTARKPGDVILAVIGFLFIMWVAGFIGSAIGGAIPYAKYVVQAVALWAFIFTIPAAVLGGTPPNVALSASLQTAKRNPAATALLAVISLVVYFGLTVYGFEAVAPYLHNIAAFELTQLLLQAIALGYIALAVSKAYADFAFRPYW